MLKIRRLALERAAYDDQCNGEMRLKFFTVSFMLNIHPKYHVTSLKYKSYYRCIIFISYWYDWRVFVLSFSEKLPELWFKIEHNIS